MKETCYGTIVYLPPGPIVDFGKEVWPAVHEKQKVCPRLLLVANWTDGRFFLVGGGVDKGESPLDAMNREFGEEMGSPGNFTEDDYCFSVKCSNRECSHIYGKTTPDLDMFNSILQAFYQNCDRKAYMEEVMAATGLPVWVEGPESLADFKFGNGIHGLPRMLGTGGAFKVHGESNKTREYILLLLHYLKVVDTPLLTRIFDLAAAFTSEQMAKTEGTVGHICARLSSYAEFTTIPGVADLLNQVSPIESKKQTVEQLNVVEVVVDMGESSVGQI